MVSDGGTKTYLIGALPDWGTTLNTRTHRGTLVSILAEVDSGVRVSREKERGKDKKSGDT